MPGHSRRWSIKSSNLEPGLIIGSDFGFWGERINEGIRWLNMLLAAPSPPSVIAAEAWYSAAALAWITQDYVATRIGYERSYQIRAELGESTHPLLWNLGWLALAEGKVAEAGLLMEKFMVEERATLNRDLMLAWGEYGLGSYSLMVGQPIQARSHLAASLSYYRATETHMAVVDSLKKMGHCEQMDGNLAEATVCFRESLKLARTHHYLRELGQCLYGLAGVWVDQDDLSRAALLFGAAETLNEITGAKIEPDQHMLVQPYLALLHERLEPETLAARWAEGRALDWEQAVELAMQVMPQS